MKKIFAMILVMALAIACVGCGSTKTFTIDEFKNALAAEEIEVDSFDVEGQDDSFSLHAAIDGEFILTGTADKNQKVNYLRFENIGLDPSVFDNNTVFEKWYDNAMNGDINSMTLGQLSQMIVALNCISELEAFYAVAADGDLGEGLMFAINTLIRKESSDIKNWDIKVTVNQSEQSLVIEATYAK